MIYTEEKKSLWLARSTNLKDVGKEPEKLETIKSICKTDYSVWDPICDTAKLTHREVKIYIRYLHYPQNNLVMGYMLRMKGGGTIMNITDLSK